jgi:hypothetical protein
MNLERFDDIEREIGVVHREREERTLSPKT